MRILKISILISLVLLILSISSKVFAEEKIENIKDFNYIPTKEYIFVENDNGYYDIDDNGNKYFYYNMIQNQGDVIEIIYKDGTKHTYKYDGGYDDRYDKYYDSDGNKLWYKEAEDDGKRLRFIYPEQWKEHWKAGTYYATMEAFGIKKQVPITIIESPVKSIKYIPISNVYYTSDGNRSYLSEYGVYFKFERQIGDKIEVEYKDNTKKTYTYKKIKDYNEESFYDDEGNEIKSSVRIDDDQFYNNPWKVGKNNYMTVRFLGIEYRVPMELVEDEHRYETETSKNGSIIDECCFCGKIRSCFPKTIKLSNKSFKYNKKVQKPTVIIKDSRGKTVKKPNYTISYSNKNSKNVGEYTVKIKFKGNYKGTKTLTYKIKPKGVSLKKITSGSKKIKIKWNKNTTQTTGYQIQYATYSTFFHSNEQTINIKSNKTTSKTIKNLKKNKKYYVRIRTYKKVNGKKFYSSWSKTLKIKTK